MIYAKISFDSIKKKTVLIKITNIEKRRGRNRWRLEEKWSTLSSNASANEQQCDEQNPAVVEARASARSLSISMCFYCVS